MNQRVQPKKRSTSPLWSSLQFLNFGKDSLFTFTKSSKVQALE